MIVVTLWFLLIIFTSRFFKRFENNRWFWFIIGGFMFFYMLIARQVQFIIPSWNASDDGSTIAVSIRHSRLLLLDICPFFSIFAGLCLMFIKNKKIVRSLAPIALFGGLITLYGELFRLANRYSGLDVYRFIFIGFDNDQIYFMLHVMTTSVALMLLCWTTEWSPRDVLNQYLFMAIYVSYIIACTQLDRKVLANSNGIIPTDWYPGGEYQSVANILKVPFPQVIPVGVMIALVSINIIWGIRYGIQELNRKIIQPKLANKKQFKLDIKLLVKNLKYSYLNWRKNNNKKKRYLKRFFYYP
nr:DUF5378 family protein [Mycoplasma bradburyae]